MCPHCGWIYPSSRSDNGMVPRHTEDGAICPGSEQTPRNPGSDRRPLWNGEQSPAQEAAADAEQAESCERQASREADGPTLAQVQGMLSGLWSHTTELADLVRLAAPAVAEMVRDSIATALEWTDKARAYRARVIARCARAVLAALKEVPQ